MAFLQSHKDCAVEQYSSSLFSRLSKFNPAELLPSTQSAYEEISLPYIDDRLKTWHGAGLVLLVGSYISTFSPTDLQDLELLRLPPLRRPRQPDRRHRRLARTVHGRASFRVFGE